MRTGLVVLLILCSAALHAIALPPWSVSFAAWIALVPFLCVLRDLTPGRGFLAGLLWGTAAIWGVGYWVPIAFATYYEQPFWFGVLFAIGASMVFAGSYSAGFGASAAWLSRRTSGAPRAFLIASLWVVWEFARARLLTGDPWLLVGYALVLQRRLVQVADLGGVYLLSFLVVLVNATVAELLPLGRMSLRAVVRTVAPAAAVLVAATLYGAERLARPLPSEPELPLVIVQGNNDLGTQWQPAFYGRGLEQYLSMSLDAAAATHPGLIIWPESAINFFLADESPYQSAIARMLDATGADLLFGGPHQDGADTGIPRYFNSAFYMTADGVLRGRYDKTHLLPFAEYFPLRTIELLRRRFERVRSFTPGNEPLPLETRIGSVATVICFEGIFPEVVREQMARGARLLVNLSNDAWLGAGAGPEQHLAMVALRAVENRTWVVRATTTGISALIDPLGRVTARTATFVPALLEGRVVPVAIDTFYKRYGDVFAYACLAAVALAFVVLWRVPSTAVSASATYSPAAASPKST
ncbi:MAG: apolipoprotein N-acyltransferase [Deltaproteobacteria bacterium]|nr:apolipoprotein N-acyltransferase [Deltaproteobacteria bacterium]